LSGVNFYEKKLKDIGILDWGNKQLAKVGISLAAVIDNLLDYDKVLTNTSKTLGISKDGARDLADEYNSISFNVKVFLLFFYLFYYIKTAACLFFY
jgi:hypothetical protein